MPKVKTKTAPTKKTTKVEEPRKRRARGTAPPRHPIVAELSGAQKKALSVVDRLQATINDTEEKLQEAMVGLVAALDPALTLVHPETGESWTIMNRSSDPKNPRYFLRPKPTGRKPKPGKKVKEKKEKAPPKIKAKGLAAKKVNAASAATPAKKAGPKVKVKAKGKSAPEKPVVKVKVKSKAAPAKAATPPPAPKVKAKVKAPAPPKEKVKAPKVEASTGAKDKPASEPAIPPPPGS